MSTEPDNLYAAPQSDLGTTKELSWLGYYFAVLKNYVGFAGRARRKEYWIFSLISTIIAIVLGIIAGITNTPDVVGNVYNLATLLPGIAVGVRRMHDTGRSGWWLLLPLANLLFLCFDSQPGTNRYGPNPKGDIGDGRPNNDGNATNK